MFINPTEDLLLKIEGKKEIRLSPNQYYLLDRSDQKPIPVIKHDVLIKIAEENGFKVDKTILEFGVFHDPNNFCFVHRAFGNKDGVMVDEIGEANPNNLDTTIGSAYPAIMSNKRAQDRLLIRLMGLQGQVYSDVEFGGEEKRNEISSSPSGEEQETFSMEEAKELIVDYGRYKNNPVTLAELKEKYPDDFEWLCNVYKASSKSSPKMVKLHRAAKLLEKVSEG